MTVHRIVGRVEVQHQLLGHARERGNELFDQLLMNRNRPLVLGAPLEPTQRRGTRQAAVVTAGGLNDRVLTKGVMVVQIFVSQRDRVDPLAHHRHHLVANLPALAWLTEPTRDPLGQPEPAVHLAQQQRPPHEKKPTRRRSPPAPGADGSLKTSSTCGSISSPSGSRLYPAQLTEL